MVIYPHVLAKLWEKHRVTADEVRQAIQNFQGLADLEIRPKHQGKSPRYWYVSVTDLGRILKVVFTFDPDEPACPIIITAYEPKRKVVPIHGKN